MKATNSTLLRIVLVNVSLLALIGKLSAQYSQDVANLKSASEQYDERGYYGSKAISVDGKLSVGNANGNVSYSYPISSNYHRGYKLNVNLNYCNSVAFTAFHKINLSDPGYYDPESAFTYPNAYQGWSKFHQNRPAWIIGVNGFAIQAISTATHFHSDPASPLFNSMSYEFNDNHMIWLMDGYDYCNRMEDFGAGASFLSQYDDVIKLLRDDGSVLELHNINPSATSGFADSATALYTGYYHTLQANDKGYAKVEYDTTYWTPSMREIDNEQCTWFAPQIPRKVHYYAGDGLEYIFREWTAPYGMGPLRDLISRSSGVWSGPTIFYLEQIRSSGGVVTNFDRYRHYPIIPDMFSLHNVDSTRGRAPIWNFDDHTITYGTNSLTIEALGRTTKVFFNRVMLSGNAVDQDMLGDEGLWLPLGGFGMPGDHTRYLATVSETDPEPYKSWLGYVTQIVDPEGRTTNFEYEKYTTKYKNFGFPRPKNGIGNIVLTLDNLRLHRVIEPTAKYFIDYYGVGGADYNPATPRILEPPNNTHDFYTLNNVVKRVQKYDPTDTLLTIDQYYFSMHFDGNSPLIDYSIVKNTDNLTGKYKSTQFDYFADQLPSSLVGVPGPRFTELRGVTEVAGGVTTYTATQYGFLGQYPTPNTGTTWNTMFFIPELKKEVYVNSVLKQRQTFRYNVDTVRKFGFDTSLTRNFGQDAIRKITRTYDGNGTLQTLDTTDFLHLPLLDTNYTVVDTSLLKFPTQAKYEHYRDSVVALGEVCPKWEIMMFRPGIYTYDLDTVSGLASLPPTYSLTKRNVTYDASGNLLGGKLFIYDTNFIPDVSAPAPYRGGILADTIISRGDLHRVLGNSYRYDWSYGATLPSYKGNANGSGVDMFYGFLPVYNPLTGYYGGPTGKIVQDNNTVSTRELSGDYFGVGYGLPQLERKSVRRYNPAGSLVSDTLLHHYQRTFYGLVAEDVDENGWMSSFDYDHNGRVTKAVLPYDFQAVDSVTHTEFESSESYESIGWSDYTSYSDTVHCDPHDAIYTPLSYNTVLHGVLGADYPEHHIPNCSTGVVTHKKDGPSIQRTVTSPIPYDWRSPAVGHIDFLTRPDGVDSVLRIDSAYLEFYITQALGNCVNLVVEIPLLSFSETYVFNCSVPAMDSISAGNYPFRIDLSDYTNDLKTIGQIGVKFSVTTLNGQVALVSGINGEDTRPRLHMKGRFRKVDRFGDYTLAYTYNDDSLINNTSVKVDDYRHTFNTWDTTSLGRFRRTASKHYFGGDGQIRTSRLTIGSETSPIRIDTVTTSHTGMGLVSGVRDQEGDVTGTEYDELGRPVKLNNADGTFSTVTYLAGSLTTCGITASGQDFHGFCSAKITRNENGVEFKQYSDAFDRLRREVSNAHNVPSSPDLITWYEYDAAGRLTQVVNPKGDTTRYFYDEYGRVKFKQQPDLGTVSYAYDKVGNARFTQSQQQATDGKLTFTEYDDLNRPTVIGEARILTEGLASAPSVTGEPYLNRLTERIDASILQDSGQSTTVSANKTLFQQAVRSVPSFWNPIFIDSSICPLMPDSVLGETETPIGPFLKHPTQYYQPLTAVWGTPNDFENVAKYPEFPRIGISYDRLPDTLGAIWSLFPSHAKWDSLAPQKKVRNLKGHEAAVAYREHDGEPFHYAVMSYDERGRLEALLRYNDNLGFDAVYYTYNSANKVVSVRVADPMRQFTTWYGYNWNGQIDSVWTLLSNQYQGLGIATPKYVQPQTKPTSPEIVYSYTKTGQVAGMEYPAVQAFTGYAYNHRKWLDSMTAWYTVGFPIPSTQPLFKQVLAYDSIGQIISQRWKHAGMAEQTQYYSYDSLQRLTNWGNGGVDSSTYAYDAVGNRQLAANPGGIVTYSYLGSGPNQLTGLTEISGPFQTATGYSYNFDGAVTGASRSRFLPPNIMQDSVRQEFTYSWRHLTRQYTYQHMTMGPMFAEQFDWRYRYSAGGEREQKRLYSGQDAMHNAIPNHPWVYYLLGVGKGQLAIYHGQEMDQSGCAMPGWSAYMYPVEYLTYGAGDGACLITKPLGGAWAREYRVVDHLGSVRASITPGFLGNAIASFDYEPFGKLLTSSSLPVDHKSYIDKEKDKESGLSDFGVRKYSEVEGRFLAIDPRWEDFRSITPYNYAENDPVRLKDPNGDCPLCIAAGIGFLVGAGVEGVRQYVSGEKADLGKMAYEGVKGAGITLVAAVAPEALSGVAGQAAIGAGFQITTGVAERAAGVAEGKPLGLNEIAKDGVVGGLSSGLGALAGKALKPTADKWLKVGEPQKVHWASSTRVPVSMPTRLMSATMNQSAKVGVPGIVGAPVTISTGLPQNIQPFNQSQYFDYHHQQDNNRAPSIPHR